MPFFKHVEVKDAKEKYGFSHQGIYAKERIKKGEPIFKCNEEICEYLLDDQLHLATNKQETEALMNKHPDSKEFIIKYIYMVDDDLYDYPKHFIEKTLSEDCMFFNHSCEPNCGFGSHLSGTVVAIRNIEINEELTYDYQCMDTEASYYDGLQCKCGSLICRKTLKFNEYRNIDWQMRLLEYSSGYVKKKLDQLKTKWYASELCLRRCFLSENRKDENNNIALYLTTLQKIPKDHLVAVFDPTCGINLNSHFIRQSSNNNKPNCYLSNNQVFTSVEIDANTELTLDYNLNEK